MKTSLRIPARQCGFPLSKFSWALARGGLALAAVLGLPRTAGAALQYFSYSATRTAWNANNWGAASGGPYTAAWTGYNDAVFEGTGGAINLGANQQANSLTFNVPGYSLTNAGFQIQIGSPTYPGLFVTNGVTVTNASTWANSGAGSAIHVGNTTNAYNGTNVLTGNFAALVANNRALSVDAGSLYLSTATTSLGGGSGGINIAAGANLTYDCLGTVAWGTTAATILKGNGTLVKKGAGILVLGSGGQNVQVGFGAGALIDVQAGQLTGSSSARGFWATNQASMNVAAGAAVDFVEAGAASAVSTIQLDALNGAGAFKAGWGAFTKTVVLGTANGSGTFSGAIFESNGSGNGQVAVAKNGTGTQTLAGTNYFRYGLTVSGGTLNLLNTNFLSNGSIIVTNGTLNVGGPLNNAYAAAIQVRAGGVLNFTNNGTWNNANASGNYFYVGTGTGTGIVNQTAGTINYGAAAGAYLLLGNTNIVGSGDWGIYNLLGGTLTSVGQIIMGVNNTCSSMFNVSNGSLTALNGLAIGRHDAATASTTNYFNQSGGTVNVSTLYLADAGTSDYSFLNVSNGTFTATNFAGFAAGTGNAAAIYLGKGALVTLPGFPTTLGAGSTATLTFDGGTLAPYAASANYLQNLTAAYLTANGAALNVASGNDITVAQPLLDAPAQTGRLVKLGAGTLTLSGASLYSGTTTVSNGNLVVSGSLANGAVAVGFGGTLYANGSVGGPVTVAYGGTAYANGLLSDTVSLAVGATLGGIGTVNGAVTASAAASVAPGSGPGAVGMLTVNNNLTFAAGAALAVDIDTTAAGASDLLQVNGSLVNLGSMTVYFNFPNGAPELGVPYTFITSSTAGIAPSFAANLVVGTHLYSATFGQTASAVTVTFSSGPGLNQLTWQGDGTANLWQVGVTQDWTNGSGTPSFFYTGDSATFDDSATNLAVNLFGALTPASVTINSTKNFLFAGSGKITGATGLTKTGSGALTLATANDFSGNTSVTAGTLALTNGGSVAGNIIDDAKLAFIGTDTTTVTNPVSGSGAVAKGGSGGVVLTASNSYTGLTVITNGVIYPRDPSALGTADAGTVVANTGQLYVDRAIDFAAEPLVLSGAGFNGTGALRKGGASTSTLGGPVTLAAAASLAVDGGATLNLTNAAGVAGTNVNLTLAATGNVKVNGPIALGTGTLDKEAAGNATLLATNNAWTGGTLVGGGTLQIGSGAADGSLGTGSITNNGTLLFNSGNNFDIGDALTGTGNLTHNGAGYLSLNNSATVGSVTVGTVAGVAAVLNLNGPSFISAGTMTVATTANTATGIVNQIAGLVTVGGNSVLVGNGGPATYGQYNLYGGTLYATGGAYGLLLGANHRDTGVFTMTNGNLYVNLLEVGRSEASTTATNTSGYFLQSGGTAVITTLAMGGGNTTNEANTTAQLTIANASFVATNFTYLGVGTNSAVSINLGPGALVTLPPFPTLRGLNTTVNLLLDGATLTPTASSATYISALSTAIISYNGATLNVPSGLAITIPQPFAYDAAGDVCDLAKQGSGTLTLTGGNTYGFYGGTTRVNQGTLLVNGSGQIVGPVAVASGATFGGSGSIVDGSVPFGGAGTLEVAANAVLTPGSAPATPGTLTIANNCTLDAGAIVNLDLSAVTNAANNDWVNVGGTLASGGPVTVNFSFLPMPALNQPYTIFSAGALDPAFLGSLVAGPTDYPPTFAQVGNTITVTFTGGPLNQLVWQGDGGTNAWLLGLAGQWTNGLGPCVFKNSDQVTFNETATNFTVNVVGTNLPGSVTVNATHTYTFFGPGRVSGATTLVQSGPGTLVLNNTNDYTGGTFINGGILLVSNSITCLPSAPLTVTGPGTLWLAMTGATVTTPTNSISGSGTVHVTACGTGTSSVLASNDLSGFSGLIDIYPNGGGGGKLVLDAIAMPSPASAIKIQSGGTLYMRLAKNLPSSIELYGGTTGEALGQLRIEASTFVSGPITLKANSSIGGNGPGTIGGTISDGGLNYSLSKLGTGTTTLSNYNTFGGVTTISAGALLAYHQNALSNSLITVSAANGLLFGPGVGAFTLGGLAGASSFPMQATNGTTIALAVGNNNASSTYSGVMSGLGSLTKVGNGTLTLSGNNTYTGTTTVNRGVLAITGTNSSSAVSVDGTGTLAPGTVGGTGTAYLTNSLTLNAGSTLLVDLGSANTVGGGTNDLVVVGGTLSLNGAVAVGLNLTAGAPVLNQPYTLIQFAGTIGGAGGGFYATNTHYGVVFGTNTSPNAITVTFVSAPVTGTEPLVWQGDGALNQWLVGLTNEWTNALGAAVFYSGDSVILDDTATNPVVNLVGPLAPATVAVTANVNNYTLQGNGQLAGAASLTKSGSGTLMLATTNTYSGGTTINPASGSVIANLNAGQNALGSGPVTVGTGSLLQLNDNNTNSGAATYIGNALSGAGLLKLNFAAGTAARNTYVTNATAFSGMIELTNAGLTSDKWNVSTGAYPALVVIDSGSQLFATTAGTASFNGISVLGTGNAENRGAIRVSVTNAVLSAPITLLGNTTIGMEIGGATLSGPIANGTASAVTLTDGTTNSSGAGTFAGVLSDGVAGGTLALVKTSSGALALSSSNTYSGPTTVSGGSLVLSNAGDIAMSPSITLAGGMLDASLRTDATFTLRSTQTLNGSGTVLGAVVTMAGSTLTPGTNGALGTLTCQNTLTHAGNLVFKLNKSLSPQSNDLVAVAGSVVNTGIGTLTVSNLGPALAVGDTFFLFNKAMTGGDALVIFPPANVTFTNKLAVDGSIQVTSAMASNPTNITYSVEGSTLMLSWPGDHLGWYAQSNSVDVANPGYWHDVPNSSSQTNLSIALDPALTNVFYRLRKP